MHGWFYFLRLLQKEKKWDTYNMNKKMIIYRVKDIIFF
jgi:hypothetical protein